MQSRHNEINHTFVDNYDDSDANVDWSVLMIAKEDKLSALIGTLTLNYVLSYIIIFK